jgi:propanol-preferring alcohol dehydrogenase
MKAMVLKKFATIDKNPLELADIPDPEPGPEDILVKIKACGVCHTDLHTVEGELPEVKLPITPGHEIVGTVEKKGENAIRFEKGDRVGVSWLYKSCGFCSFCRGGRENLCKSAQFTGYHVNGGYAQFIVVSENYAYAVPPGFTDEEAAPLLCAGIIGYRSLRLSEVRPGQRLALYGFGASAHVVIQIAVHWGCQVYVFSRSKKHRDLAEKLGAIWTGTTKDKPPSKVDSSIIFAPAGELVIDALRVLERGGTLALAGIYMTPIPEIDYVKYLYHERTLRSVANATRKDGRELLKIATEIPIKTTIKAYPLEEANKALQLLKESKIDGAAILKIPE